jgi:hypothetical protein
MAWPSLLPCYVQCLIPYYVQCLKILCEWAKQNNNLFQV